MNSLPTIKKLLLTAPALVLLACITQICIGGGPTSGKRSLPNGKGHKVYENGGQFRIVAYFSSWGPVSKIRFEDITTLDFAFLKPLPDGTLADDSVNNKLYQIVSLAKQHNVKVIGSIGGQGTDKAYAHIAADPQLVAKFIQSIMGAVDKYNLDGIDLDWEYPSLTDNGVESGELSSLVLVLSQQLHQKGKELTMAVSAKAKWGALVPDDAVRQFDYINLMAYDSTEDPIHRPNHSSYEFAVGALSYWIKDRHVPNDKVVLGVPTYGRGRGVVPPYYKELVAKGANPNDDSFTSPAFKSTPVYYNGLPTMGRKVDLALRTAGGIMIWEVNGDTDDPQTSLIHEIGQKAKGKMIRKRSREDVARDIY